MTNSQHNKWSAFQKKSISETLKLNHDTKGFITVLDPDETEIKHINVNSINGIDLYFFNDISSGDDGKESFSIEVSMRIGDADLVWKFKSFEANTDIHSKGVAFYRILIDKIKKAKE